MEKINYGDINKFLVSVGIVLIVLSVLSPYLYLKEDFGLYVESDIFDKFQEPVRDIILLKQLIVLKMQNIILYISLGLFLCGICTVIWGMRRWFKRQAKIDEKFDKEIEKLSLEIVAMTPEEKEEKAKQEVKEIENIEQTTYVHPKTPPSEYVSKYITIEKSVIDVFQNYHSTNFTVLSQQKLGNRYEIDILLKSKSKKYLDRIIEIKYFRNKLSPKIIKETVNRMNTQISYYNSVANHKSLPVLLIVYSETTTNSEDISRFEERVKSEIQGLPNLERLKVEFVEEKQIDNFDVQKILKK